MMWNRRGRRSAAKLHHEARTTAIRFVEQMTAQRGIAIDRARLARAAEARQSRQAVQATAG
jgi:hypothetical protein